MFIKLQKNSVISAYLVEIWIVKWFNYNFYYIEDTTEQSWADMAESNDAGEKPPSQSKHVNVQDVIVASAGDDGDVWIWKPLQVKQTFVFCRASSYIEDGKRYSANISKLC